jgi:hypothetical protein
MKIISTKKIEGCLESSSILDIYFDNPIAIDFAKHIGTLGKLAINETLGKPFFRVIVKSKYTIKGSIENKKCRIVFPDGARTALPEEFRLVVEQYTAE